MSACPSCDAQLARDVDKFCSHCGHDLQRPSGRTDFDGLIGQIVEGRYRVAERIGTGGMGVVYRVEHVRMGKIAAMKVLRRDLVDDGQAARRFRREVEAVSRLEHPNIIQTFDYGEWRGLSYLVMEYVRGQDMSAIIKREGPMPPARALPLFAQVCSALEEAHEKGIIHRDLKPDNIVCLQRRNQGETVKVLDFGLAKLRERSALAEVTGAGSLIGTPYYMAPEQVRSEVVDERSDVYSLGATLYRVLTGTPPFQAETPMAILGKHLTDEVEPPSRRRPGAGISLAIDHLVLKAMSKDRGNRYATAVELRAALEDAFEGLAAGDSAPGPAPLPAWVENPVTSSSEEAPSAPTVMDRPPSEENSGREGRLRREDVDAFERALRRRKVSTFLFLSLVLAAGAWSAHFAWKRLGGQAGLTEEEPNNTTATGNRVSSGAPLYGHVGPPQPDGTPDMDYFHAPLGKQRRALVAQVTALPDIDLVLEAYDSSGKLLARSDGGKVAEGEILGPVQAGPLDAFLRVRPVWVQGEVARESETPYALTVSWHKPDPAWELEPNDDAAAANALPAAGRCLGYLTSDEDVDNFVFAGRPGQALAITLAREGESDGDRDGLDLALTIDGQPIDRGRAEDDEQARARIGATGRVHIRIGESPRQRAANSPRPQRHRPYVLSVRVVD